MTKIGMCKQQNLQTVSQYLTRLTEVYNAHSGFTLPEEMKKAVTPYEGHLCNSFINFMKEPIIIL